jgi:serine/threonine protein kinase
MEFLRSDREQLMNATVDISDGKNSKQAIHSSGIEQLPSVGRAFMDNLLRSNLLSASMADRFLESNARRLPECDSAAALGEFLIEAGLLTQYQFDRIMAGTAYGLVLGQYRVLERLGAGGMGIVFLAQHMLMKRKVAIKVLPVDDNCPPDVVKRFYVEMQVLAQLHHPNIVMAFDSGRVDSAPGFPRLLYLVMELVDGCDLERYVDRHGPVPIGTACNWIRQAALGLQEAHNHNLVHRDIKPSNLLLTKDGKVKLVDFGLVRQFSSTMTDPKAALGTLDFMPPEQSVDPSSVGTLADIYSLGATLFWLLTAQPVYPRVKSLMAAMKQIQENPPQRLRSLRPDAPPELEAVLLRLLDRDPTRRPPMALNVMKYLEPFAAD